MDERGPTRAEPVLQLATALRAECYVRQEWFERERDAVFARSWQLVAHTSRLRTPGDHVVDEIAGRPLLVVRQHDGSLRAFYNVCRHRAGPLALCDGNAHALRCKYHGWTYGLDGVLQRAPEMEEAADFDPATIRLPALRVREWQSLVFVAMDAAAPLFDEVFAGIAARSAPLDLNGLAPTASDHYEVACNWKVYVDNFLEGYHLPHVHPGLTRVLDYRTYDTELFRWHSLQHSPIRNANDAYGDGEALYWFVYPNVMLNMTPGRLQTNRVVPLAVDRCRVDFDYYHLPDAAASARAAADRAFSDEVQREDGWICERVHANLRSGAYEAGRLCPKRESGVWHFHELLRRSYSATP